MILSIQIGNYLKQYQQYTTILVPMTIMQCFVYINFSCNIMIIDLSYIHICRHNSSTYDNISVILHSESIQNKVEK